MQKLGVLLTMAVVTFGALALLWFAARGAITICVAEVREGKVAIARGGLAPRVLADIADVMKRPRVGRATIRITRARGRAEVHASGDLSEAQLQQLRNVVGSVPVAKLANTHTKR